MNGHSNDWRCLVAHESQCASSLMQERFAEVGYESEFVDCTDELIRALEKPVDRVFCSNVIAAGHEEEIDEALRRQVKCDDKLLPIVILKSTKENANEFNWLGPLIDIPITAERCCHPVEVNWDDLLAKCGDSHDIVFEILKMALDETPRLLAEARKAVQSRDLKNFGRLIHNIGRGSFYCLGGYLALLGEWANEHRGTQDCNLAGRILRSCERTWSLTVPRLDRVLAEHSIPTVENSGPTSCEDET